VPSNIALSSHQSQMLQLLLLSATKSGRVLWSACSDADVSPLCPVSVDKFQIFFCRFERYLCGSAFSAR
jgi:hypothetical protein